MARFTFSSIQEALNFIDDKETNRAGQTLYVMQKEFFRVYADALTHPEDFYKDDVVFDEYIIVNFESDLLSEYRVKEFEIAFDINWNMNNYEIVYETTRSRYNEVFGNDVAPTPEVAAECSVDFIYAAIKSALVEIIGEGE